jgi:hypothetical protein
MTAGVAVMVMLIIVRVFMGVSHRLMAVLMPVMAVSLSLVGVLMLMLVLVMAAHFASLLSG